MKYVVPSIMNPKPKAILIDSSNLLHRAVWIAENVRTNVNPSYIFLTSVKKYVQMFDCTNVYSVWDKRLIRGIKNYRRLNKKTEYKGTRDEEKNAKVFSHEDATTKLLESLGVKNMYPGILEADDVISWLCGEIDEHKVVVSVDQDMLQLVDDQTTVYSPIKDVLIDHKNFDEVTGVPMSEFLRYKSLVGDKSDNLPGVDRVGKKTAQKLLRECVDDQALIDKLGEERLKPYFVNLKMIDLQEGHRQHPDDIDLYKQQYRELIELKPDYDQFIQQCIEMNIRKIVSDVSLWKQVFSPVDVSQTLQDIVNKLDLNK